MVRTGRLTLWGITAHFRGFLPFFTLYVARYVARNVDISSGAFHTSHLTPEQL